jgi:glycosyltransferase involved in cell wall biosynthesis
VRSSRLRIAFVYDALYPEIRGGGERRFHEIGKRLSDRHEVHVVSWRYWRGGDNVIRDGMRLHAVGAARPLYGKDGRRTVREAISFAARLFPVMLRQRFDVINCSATPYAPLYACWVASRLTRTPLVTVWHEFWGDYWLTYLGDRPLVARVARGVERESRRFGDIVVPISPHTARRMGLDPTSPHVRIVGGGVPLDEIAVATPSHDPCEVVFVGRLIDDKRVDLLIEAVALLGQRFPQLRCLVIGGGPERPNLERLATTLELGDRLRFAGQLDNATTYGYLKAASVLVMPSVREGFSNTVVEAQACGAVPVVVRSPMSAAPDLVHDGVDGVVVDPTGESIAGAITGLLTQPERLQAMRAAALESAQRRGWEVVAAQMETIYTDAVAARRTSSRAALA